MLKLFEQKRILIELVKSVGYLAVVYAIPVVGGLLLFKVLPDYFRNTELIKNIGAIFGGVMLILYSFKYKPMFLLTISICMLLICFSMIYQESADINLRFLLNCLFLSFLFTSPILFVLLLKKIWQYM